MNRIKSKLLEVLAVCSALNLQISTSLAQGTPNSWLTITNPPPAANDFFGYSVAAVGNDRVLIGAINDDTGAENAGAAFLFSTNGTLLITFTNPTPAVGDEFGISLAAMGSDRVLIGTYRDDTGATDAGAAYLLSITGALLTTFTNPTPAANDNFGFSVAAVGNDRVLIGAYRDDTGATNAGATYLFNTNGALLATITNPMQVAGDNFGFSVTAVGNDRVLIGAPFADTGATDAGAAYLLSITGALLTTFTNPTPAANDRFGWSVATVGIDGVLIGAYFDDTGATDAGAAYLFSTNGALLSTFTVPTAAPGDAFGYSVAAAGTDRVLIGTPSDNTGVNNAGAAYLFRTDGTMLTTVTNPTPAPGDSFGWSVAVMGTDRVLIGAPNDDTGGLFAGAAYLFGIATIVPPQLNIQLTATNTVAISWPSPSTGFTLQQNTNSVAGVNWSNAPGTIQDDGTAKTLIVNPPTGNRFYRLFKP